MFVFIATRAVRCFSLVALAALAACGGGSDEARTAAAPRSAAQAAPSVSNSAERARATSALAAADASGRQAAAAAATVAVSAADAVRLAHQGTFGPTEALVAEIQRLGPAEWVRGQIGLSGSRYSSGRGDAIHRNTQNSDFCSLPANAGPNCWRDWFSNTPLVWDFFRNSTQKPDQLRQRVALALQQIFVVSQIEVTGTYALRNYQNMLLDNAFGNYRDLLKKVTMSPVMGAYLDNVNSDAAAPSENFARELLQLFSIGTCQLNADGSLKGGACQATYDNEIVRNYAYALTGWTYPAGGATAWGCWPEGANCIYFNGEMVAVSARHDRSARALLSGVTVPAGIDAYRALESVLDSLMAHPNIAPFVGRQLIQHLVSSNPSPAYVQRVAGAFSQGRYTNGATVFGGGRRGDLSATVAAVLLDAEARTAAPARTAGQLREPVLMMTGVLRALNGRTDGEALGSQWGEPLRQHLFRAPSVFNYYPPDYPVPGGALAGPAFAIHNANTALERLNYLSYLMYWGGSTPNTSVPGALGTQVDLVPFEAGAGDAAALVDRLSTLAVGGPLPAATRGLIVDAVATYTDRTHRDVWRRERVRQAAYLVFASPDYQIQF